MWNQDIITSDGMSDPPLWELDFYILKINDARVQKKLFIQILTLQCKFLKPYPWYWKIMSTFKTLEWTLKVHLRVRFGTSKLWCLIPTTHSLRSFALRNSKPTNKFLQLYKYGVDKQAYYLRGFSLSAKNIGATKDRIQAHSQCC